MRDAGRIAKGLCSVIRKSDLKQRLSCGVWPTGFSRSTRGFIRRRRCSQALRIAVNRARESIEEFYETQLVFLKTGIRIAVLSFHSGEERTVQADILGRRQDVSVEKEFPVCRCGRKRGSRSYEERWFLVMKSVPRESARSSAKLRIAERI